MSYSFNRTFHFYRSGRGPCPLVSTKPLLTRSWSILVFNVLELKFWINFDILRWKSIFFDAMNNSKKGFTSEGNNNVAFSYCSFAEYPNQWIMNYELWIMNYYPRIDDGAEPHNPLYEYVMSDQSLPGRWCCWGHLLHSSAVSEQFQCSCPIKQQSINN